ncbi:unnamed protein product, partial [Anisakis simplex]|uniref:Alanine--glyoxylate aminotransferase 2, mitochondrial n=1 Tax=Anisakis simplex TaxID=6269 RepID=A0A0M3JBG8_ANISI
MCPDPYKGPWGGRNCRDSLLQPKRSCECNYSQCKACDEYMNELHNALKYEYAENGVAGMLIESIQGVGGVVQFPKEFIKRAFDTIHSKGGICISDEVQTGFGRLGSHFWGFQSQDANPDIVTMAKGIANGFPMGVVVTTEEIAKSHSKPLYMNTFGGNPLACTVAKAVLEVIEEEKLQENSEKIGEFIM